MRVRSPNGANMAIKIKPIHQCPSAQAWAEELERESIGPRWLAHLEQCTNCQRVLESVAAEPKLWSEAQETLADRPVDLTHITESIAPLAMDGARNLLNDPLCEFEVSQLQRLLPVGPSGAPSSSGCSASYPPCEAIARIGRYDLEQLIGRGGMGLVFRAWDTQLHRVVAVKTLAMSLWSLPSARERFIREGRAAAMLSHAHIVPMYDVINDPPVPALVMQYIAGPTLDEWIHQRGPMAWPQALRIALQLADALCAAHAEGLVHRDIKPGNVLLEADGTRALLTDFGLVRAMDDATLTQSGMLAGTPHFMSPEQARGEDVDGRSDLFSLGSMIYYVISGQTPFRGRESMSVLNSLCHVPHVPLVRVHADVPVEVSRLVDRLLQKQPQQRPASSIEVRDKLRLLLAAEKRLRPKQKLTKRGKRGIMLGLCAAVALALLMVPRWMDPRLDLAYPPVQFSVSNANALADPSSTGEPGESDGVMSALSHSDKSLTMNATDVEGSNLLRRLPAPNASELDVLATQINLLDEEISRQSMLLDSRIGEGESLSTAIWQATQELDQIQFGLRLNTDEKVVSPAIGVQ